MSSKAWVFGDDINTDVLAPGLYMKGPLEVLASHCLETVNPDFASDVRPGDIIVGGQNFGIGSSREQAAQTLHHLGIRTIIAQSFAGIFFRNSLNFGVITLVCDAASKIKSGDQLRADPVNGVIVNLTQGEDYSCEVLPASLLEMVNCGGLVPHLKQKLAAKEVT